MNGISQYESSISITEIEKSLYTVYELSFREHYRICILFTIKMKEKLLALEE